MLPASPLPAFSSCLPALSPGAAYTDAAQRLVMVEVEQTCAGCHKQCGKAHPGGCSECIGVRDGSHLPIPLGDPSS